MSRASDSVFDDHVDDGSALSDLLAALQAPDQPDELDGLDAAMSAFFRIGPAAQRSFATPPPPGRNRHRQPRAFTRSLLLKVAALIGGASVVGGIALAAHVGGITDGPKHRPPAPGGGPGGAVSVTPGPGRETSATPERSGQLRSPTPSNSVTSAGRLAGPTGASVGPVAQPSSSSDSAPAAGAPGGPGQPSTSASSTTGKGNGHGHGHGHGRGHRSSAASRSPGV